VKFVVLLQEMTIGSMGEGVTMTTVFVAFTGLKEPIGGMMGITKESG
jgi:hypothetical protein